MKTNVVNPNFRISKAVVHHTAEDELIKNFFNLGNSVPGFFVDIGGNLPFNAVSKPFLESGWNGILIEPIPKNAEAFKSAGWPIVEQVAVTSPNYAQRKTATFYLGGGIDGPHSSLDLDEMDPRSRNYEEITVELRTLQELLEQHNVQHISLLSIDTEGTELDVLRGIDFSRTTIELILIEDWQRDSKIHRYLRKNGFRIILRSGFNSWYVPLSSKLTPPISGYLKLLKKIYLSSHIKRLRHNLDLMRAKRGKR